MKKFMRAIIVIIVIVFVIGWSAYHTVLPTGRAETKILQLRKNQEHKVKFRNLRKSDYPKNDAISRGKVCGELKFTKPHYKMGSITQGDFTRFVFEEFEIDGIEAHQFSLFPVNQASTDMLKNGFMNAENSIQYSDNFYKKVCLNAK